jgi:hypothetical protein
VDRVDRVDRVDQVDQAGLGEVVAREDLAF